MKIRIDLLDASERRHQGAVSPRFAWRALLLTAVAATALGTALAVYVTLDDRQAVRRGREIWAGLQPRRDAAQGLRQRSGEAAAYLRELDGWRNAHIVWSIHLESLQRAVPSDMQLVRLDIHDEIAADRPKAKDETPTPYRKLHVKLGGRAIGDRPEDIVSRFISALRGIGAPQPLCPSVRLAYLQADPLQPGLSSVEMEAEGEPRPLKSP